MIWRPTAFSQSRRAADAQTRECFANGKPLAEHAQPSIFEFAHRKRKTPFQIMTLLHERLIATFDKAGVNLPLDMRRRPLVLARP